MSRMFATFFLIVLLTGCSPSSEALPTQSPTPSPSSTPESFEFEIIDPLEFQSGDANLVGRLYLPVRAAELPALVMVHGSGQRVRDESMRIATELASSGIAVFRYDKRGVGDSEGRYSGVLPSNSVEILAELAMDASAAVDFVRGLEGINEDEVGLLGNSQAGWIMPQTANMNENVSFAVLLVSPAVSVAMENYYSARTRQNAANTTPEQLAEISEDLASFEGPGYDPRADIEAMNIPAIWILGGRDESIPTIETVQILEEVRDSLTKDFDIHIYPDGTHSLAHAETGEFFDWLNELVIDWIFATLEN